MDFAFDDGDRTGAYYSRCENRQLQLMRGTMTLIGYFISKGDIQSVAEGKVSQVSTEGAPFLYAYVLGNTTPLINSINNSALPFMDTQAKATLVATL